jgi:hypothetical protein
VLWAGGYGPASRDIRATRILPNNGRQQNFVACRQPCPRSWVALALVLALRWAAKHTQPDCLRH